MGSRKKWVVIAALVAVLALFLWKFPRWALERASDHYADCENQIYDTGEPANCKQGGLLFLPKLVPWTRREARELQSRIDYHAAEDALKAASLLDLDAKARDRAASQLLDALTADPRPKTIFTTTSLLRSAGADVAMIEHAADLEPGHERGDALVAALSRGDIAAAQKIAALPAGTDGDKFDVASGALACATGDVARGLAALRRADDAFVKETHSHGVDIQYLMAACDPKQPISVDDVWRNQVTFVHAIAGSGTGELDNRYGSDDIVVALELGLHRGDLRDESLVKLVSESETFAPVHRALSPWSLLNSPGPFPLTPDWADAATVALLERAKTVKPSKDKYDEPALRDPAPYLRYAAWVVALEAAYGWARRGNSEHALASAKQALALAHDPDVVKRLPLAPELVIATLELVGDWTTATSELDALIASAPPDAPDYRALLDVQRSLVLAHAGKIPEAYAALDQTIALKVDTRTAANVRWLRAALASVLGKSIDFPLPTPKDKLDMMTEPLDQLAFWHITADANPAAQALVRWRTYDSMGMSSDIDGVLPAMYVMIARAAGKGDAELWLDIATASYVDNPQAIASARAEAARWRGDAAAAKRWDDRLAALRALGKDNRSVYLLERALRP